MNKARLGGGPPWWESATIYQIYPRSFQDSNGDGVGDLAGIRRRLDYLSHLGVDAIWLSPIFPSPMADFGYDVSDHCGIDPVFGTEADFDVLLDEVHRRGMKLLLDFIPNHTSDRHPWFLESRSSRQSPKRDWYIWRDPGPDGGPPNNWTSDMGGSAWEFDPRTGQYYMHAFLKEQPDLNWREAAVRDAMMGVLRHWFDRGVDGFRIDVLWHCIKAADFRDNPRNPEYRPGMGDKLKVLQEHSTDQPEVHEVACAFRRLADRYGDRLLVGEIYLPLDRLMRYYGTRAMPGVHLPFNFQLLAVPWNAADLARTITAYEAALPRGGWPNWVLGNHDRPRIAARLGEAQARVAAMLLLTLRGTPTLYQGDELGIGKVTVPPERARDPQELRQPGLNLGRDGFRTPMAWDNCANAGFSTADPWLPLHGDWPERNVARALRQPESMLNLYRRLLDLRRGSDALRTGAFRLVSFENDVLVYERRRDGDCLIVALNLSDQPRDIGQWGAPVLSTRTDWPAPGTLRADEGLILQCRET